MASSGKVAVGGCHYGWVPPGLGVTMGTTGSVPTADGTGDLVASSGKVAMGEQMAPWMGVTVVQCHPRWVPPGLSITMGGCTVGGCYSLCPHANGTRDLVASCGIRWVGGTMAGCHRGSMPPWVPLTLSPLQMALRWHPG